MDLGRITLHHRSVASPRHRPKMSLDQVLAWATPYHKLTVTWPTKAEGQSRIARRNLASRQKGTGMLEACRPGR